MHNALQAAKCGSLSLNDNNVELVLNRAGGKMSRFRLVYATPHDYPSTPLLIVPDDPMLSGVAEVRATQAR